MLSSFPYAVLRICRVVATGTALTAALGPAGAATYGLDEMLIPEEPPATTRYFAPDETSSLDESGRAAVQNAMNAFAQSRFVEAEAIARDLVEASPDAAEGWYVLGLALANQDRFDEALEALDASAARYTQNAQPLVIKGDILTFLDRGNEAMAAYRAATDKDPGQWQLQERLGLVAEREGRLDDAVERFELAAAASPPDRPFPHVKLANLHFRQGRPEAAVSVMQARVDAAPDDLRSLAALGHMQRNAGQVTAAIDTFRALAERAPDEPSATLELTRALLADGRIEDALSELQAAAERLEPDAAIQSELGRVLAGTRDYEAARTEYARGLEIAPDDPALLKGASLVEYRIGDFDQALAHAQRLAELRPENGGDLAWLGAVNEAVGNTDAAIDAYEDALNSTPGNWVARNNLAALLTDRDPNRAVELAREALEAAPDVTAVQDTLGWARYSAGDMEGALTIFTRLHEAEPGNAKYALRLGQVQAALGQTEAARRSLAQAAELDPELSDDVDALMEEL